MKVSIPMVIGDRLTEAASGARLEQVNPATENVHACVPYARTEDVARAVAAARGAFEGGPWPRLTPTERGKLLATLGELISERTDELALMDTEDMGKPLRYAREGDLPGAVEILRFYAGFCDKVRGSQIPGGYSQHVYTVREPVGVVAGIVPWNFPLALAVQKLAPALACGNTIVLKPAEQSPRSALRLAALCLEAGFPPGVVNAVSGLGETTGAMLAADPGVDKISFTGSTEVGKLIMHAAAEQLRKVSLELGGKSANIVFADADLEAALASAVFTCCYNTGQICSSGSRLLLERGVHDDFLGALVDRMKAIKVGDPLAPETKIGPLVSRDQYERVTGYIAQGEKEYPPIVCGQRSSLPDRGFYVSPTLFDHVDPDSRIAQEEIFGPVLSVIEFNSEEEAVRIANQTRYGLAAAVWTKDLNRAHRMAAQVDTGVVWVNCVQFGGAPVPCEGHRQSGVGVDMGTEVIESYTKLKSVIVNLDPTPNAWANA